MIVDEIALLPKKVRENLDFTSFTRNCSVPLLIGGSLCHVFLAALHLWKVGFERKPLLDRLW